MAKTKAETIVYPVHNGLYVNLTNRCSCACTFCIRQTADGVGQDGEGGENNTPAPTFTAKIALLRGDHGRVRRAGHEPL